eukprot:TRINITY_DN21343_c0_g1_i1.p1 TRINITY_DN21343_c0_g1~~TRINITY_DN21343_c0_g1_i1.p1  ORF type:complete len:545 (+),score=151.49 TRINITY_DN21343_c0_g1_i1:115-1749(+)
MKSALRAIRTKDSAGVALSARRWCSPDVWQERKKAMRLYRPDTDEKHKGIMTQADVMFSRTTKRIVRAMHQHKEGEVVELLLTLANESEICDAKIFPGYQPGQPDPMEYMGALGGWAANNPKFYRTLVQLLQSRDPVLVGGAAEILTSCLNWAPEMSEELVEELPLLKQALVLADRTYRQHGEDVPRVFAALVLLLHATMRCHSGSGKPVLVEGLAEAIRPYDLVEWWRAVHLRFKDLVDASAVSVMGFNGVLMEAMQSDPAYAKRVTIEDLKLVAKGMKEAEAASVRANDASETYYTGASITHSLHAVGLIVALRHGQDDYAFLTEVKNQKWLMRFARSMRGAKWTRRETFCHHADTLFASLVGATCLAERWPVEVAQAGLPVLAMGKLRYAIGFIQKWLKESAPAKASSTGESMGVLRREIYKENEQLIQKLMEFLGSYAEGELLDMRFLAAAYNVERTALIKLHQFHFLLVDILKMYPANGVILSSSIPIIYMLLEHPEQIYEIREANLLQALGNARAACKDMNVQHNVMKLMKMISGMLP